MTGVLDNDLQRYLEREHSARNPVHVTMAHPPTLLFSFFVSCPPLFELHFPSKMKLRCRVTVVHAIITISQMCDGATKCHLGHYSATYSADGRIGKQATKTGKGTRPHPSAGRSPNKLDAASALHPHLHFSHPPTTIPVLLHIFRVIQVTLNS